MSVTAVVCTFLDRQEKYQKKPAKGALRKWMNYSMIATGNHDYYKFAARSTTPLETPAATPSDTRKCPDFRASTERNLPAFFIVGVQKSEHFWTPAGEAAGGVHRGGWCSAQRIINHDDCRWQSYQNSCIFVAPPLCRVLWLLSWRGGLS